MATFYLMVGLPASGKSSYATRILQRQGQTAIVCPDTIRAMTHEDDDDLVFKAAKRQTRTLLNAEKDVIFDATSTIRQYRQRLITLAHEYGAHVVAVWMDVPLHTCLSRHDLRQRDGLKLTLDRKVILQMDRQLKKTPPALDEGFDQVVRITPDTEAALVVA